MPALPQNNRIFYACQAIALGKETSLTDFVEIHGVQSVGINTTFNLEQVFELGQIEIYENIEGTPDIEVTIEKVLDGYPLLYRMATLPTGTYSSVLGDNTLIARTKNKCSAILGIYTDSYDTVATLDAPIQIYMSGLYLNNVTYTLPVEGNCTESVTLVGNHKAWLIDSTSPKISSTRTSFFRRPANSGDPDHPQNLDGATPLGGVQRRENVSMTASVLPNSIFGIDTTGVGNNWDATNKCPKAHIQNITISTDLGREDILELGRKMAYYKAPNFPVEVTCEIEVLSVSGDAVSAYELGNPALFQPSPAIGTDEPHPSGNNTREETILIRLEDGTGFYLGKKNRLSSVTYGGGDAGGGNATSTYSFVGYNELVVVPPIAGNGVASIDLLSGLATIPKVTNTRYGEP